MGIFEKMPKAANERECLAQEIQRIKKEAEVNPDAINIHLKDIDEQVLFASLEEVDYEAFGKAFGNKWTEESADFKKYMEDVLEWKKREKMDSGASPTLKVRRDFAAMIRNYVVDRTAELKKEEKENIMKIAKNVKFSNN